MSQNLSQVKHDLQHKSTYLNQKLIFQITGERTIKLHLTTKINSQWSNLEILIYNIQCRLVATKLEAMLSRIVDISCTVGLSRLSSTVLSATSGNESGGTKLGSSSMILKAGSRILLLI